MTERGKYEGKFQTESCKINNGSFTGPREIELLVMIVKRLGRCPPCPAAVLARRRSSEPSGQSTLALARQRLRVVLNRFVCGAGGVQMVLASDRERRQIQMATDGTGGVGDSVDPSWRWCQSL